MNEEKVNLYLELDFCYEMKSLFVAQDPIFAQTLLSTALSGSMALRGDTLVTSFLLPSSKIAAVPENICSHIWINCAH